MNILGLSFMYHDSAACLLTDGRVVAAAAEERFSRKKHSLDFPRDAIAACLKIGGIGIQDLDVIVFYEKPMLKFERILTMNALSFPKGFVQFAESMPLWLKYKLFVEDLIRDNTGFRGKVCFADHHYAHAASAFFSSGFDDAAILTMDGVGEWATLTRGRGTGNRVTLTHEMRYPHSLGLLYSTLTAFLGFKVNGGEGKVMGLASYGKPTFYDAFMKDLVDMRPDGSFRLDLDWFSFHRDLVMYSPKFVRRFGPPRVPESAITERDQDLAASLQKVVETSALRAAETLQRETGSRRICIAGGVGLNSVTNGMIREQLGFEDIFITPASGDDGGALGSALYYWHQVHGGPRVWRMTDAFLGPSSTPEEVRRFLDLRGVPYVRLPEDRLLDRVADDLVQGRFVGWMQGRMEYGPRALGNRSILANPMIPGMKNTLNRRVKFREVFRPFAPACPLERTAEFFEPSFENPYMLLVVRTRPDKAALLPEVTHVDGTARLQTVTREQNPRFHALIHRFGERTGVPVVLNTSFNVRGEPIVCDHGDALDCFLNTDLDRLVIEDCYLAKVPPGEPGAFRPLVQPEP